MKTKVNYKAGLFTLAVICPPELVLQYTEVLRDHPGQIHTTIMPWIPQGFTNTRMPFHDNVTVQWYLASFSFLDLLHCYCLLCAWPVSTQSFSRSNDDMFRTQRPAENEMKTFWR